jgi:hypothetical protein
MIVKIMFSGFLRVFSHHFCHLQNAHTKGMGNATQMSCGCGSVSSLSGYVVYSINGATKAKKVHQLAKKVHPLGSDGVFEKSFLIQMFAGWLRELKLK